MTSFKYLFGLAVGTMVLQGCHLQQPTQLSGSSVQTSGRGNTDVVTYVTAEEYERMTPQERQRLNAQMGASVSATLGSRPTPTRRSLSPSELDKAMAEAKRASRN